MPRARAFSSARWIAGCALAECLGIGTAGAVAVLFERMFGAPQTWAGRAAVLGAMALAGAVEGSALGFAQWRELRWRVPTLQVRAWLGVTVAAAVIGWGAGMSGPVLAGAGDGSASGSAAAASAASAEPPLAVILLMSAGVGVAAGLFFGGAQWLVLRRHVAREQARRWVVINAAAWAPAMAAIFAGASIPSAQWSLQAIVASGAAGGLVGGTLLGVVTLPVASRLGEGGARGD